MSLAQRLEEAVKPEFRCKFARSIEHLDPEDQETAHAWVPSGGSANALARALRDDEVNVSSDVIRRHAGGVCGCTG